MNLYEVVAFSEDSGGHTGVDLIVAETAEQAKLRFAQYSSDLDLTTHQILCRPFEDA